MSNKKTEQTVGEEEVEIDIDDGSIISEVELSDGGEELGEDDESIESAIPDDNENDEFEIEGYDADDGLDGEGKTNY